MSTAEIDALRKSMQQAQVFGKGQYFEPGRYHLEVTKLFYKRTIVEGAAKENIICEFKVLESSVPSIEIGSTRSSVFAFHHKGWLPRFKALVLALIGVDPDSKYPPAADVAATDVYVALRSEEERVRLGLPDNFMAGKFVRAEGMAGKSLKGGDVTNMKWMPSAGPAAA